MSSCPNISKADLSERIAAVYKTDKDCIISFGFWTQLGGSTGFALIYDNKASQKKLS